MPDRSSKIATVVAICAAFGVAPAALAQPQAANASIGTEIASGTSAPVSRWTGYIREASRRFGIAEDWIKAVMRIESGGHNNSADGLPMTSRAGAMGLMQLMPETWHDMQKQYGLGSDPYDPHDNVLAGTAYLRWLYQRYGFPKMFAAYNAGPGTLDQSTAGVRDLPAETRNYMRGISRILGATPQTLSTPPTPPEDQTAPASGLLTFTRPDGAEVQIDPAEVKSVRTPILNEYAPGVRTVISMGGLRRQGVEETPDKVMAELKSHGAHV